MEPLGWIGLLATIILAPIAASLLQLAVSRQREYLPLHIYEVQEIDAAVRVRA